jgi:hypothetical protein
MLADDVDTAVSADHPVVFFVRSDPEPENTVRRADAQRPMTSANPHRPIHAYSLEVQGGVLRISAEELIFLTRKLLKVWGELVKMAPKAS